jgi:hypothetical protein
LFSEEGEDLMKDEWTFYEAKKHWKRMTRAVQHVGVPGCQWQVAVLWDGSLVFGPLGFRSILPMQEEITSLGNNLLHVSVGYGAHLRFIDRRGIGKPAIRRSLEDGRLPIPHIETQEDDFIWHETVFAHLYGRKLEDGMKPRSDDLLVAHALFKVRKTGGGSGCGHLWLHFGDTSQVRLGYKVGTGEDLGKSLAHRFEAPLGIVENKARYLIPTPSKGRLLWHVENSEEVGDEVATSEGVNSPPKNVIEWEVPLAPGEEAELRLIVPYGLVDVSTAERLLALDSDVLLSDARHFWKRLLDGQSAITTPDDFVNDYAAAVVGQMAQQVGYRHKSRLWMYKTSPNHYEGYWPCNAAMALPTLDLRGLIHISRPVLQSFIDFQTDDVGALEVERREGEGIKVAGEGFERRPGFFGNFGYWTANTLLLSHGLELWALASHYRITRDAEWLGDGPGSPLNAILDACDWLIAQRRRTMREENGKKVPHWGLLPAASAHDWLSGNTIFNDAYCIYGMIEAVRLLCEIGHPRTEELTRELNDYRACLRERYIEARNRARRVPMPDGVELPYVPRDVYELDWAKTDWTYTGYGPLRAGAWGALEPHDELVDQAIAFLEAGMPKGEGFYFGQAADTADVNFQDVSNREADRHFLWRHYVEYETMWPIGCHLFLSRDDLKRFFEWFFHNLSIVLHHEWRVGVESLDGVPSCAPGDGERWRAIRNMFVNERGGYDGSQQSLWLLQAIPRSWLKPGDHLSAKDMHTYFGGHVDLEVDVAQDGNNPLTPFIKGEYSVVVSAKIDIAVPPTEIRIRLRSGDGRPLVSAEINGASTPVIDCDTIKLPTQIKGEYKIIGCFETR